ncbi:acyl carrier protein [Streptomyces actinomycinicus]|uniref:Acyl carrier protein n=1 Tax=Streptomyces actinomycinicus TaxID=1695166 RepID=A0A937JT52_9ACTN|nr:acyl carrier protein [Streptomyces actinomycinicus]MBL1087432.1 acyl carrier protein [Streptomyces actinomycinicus]
MLRRPVAPGTSFYDQGGDSLGAARVLALLRKALDVPVDMSDFVAAPSVRELAGRLAALPGVEAAARAAVRAATERRDGAPPTGLARGLLAPWPATAPPGQG